MDRLSKLIEEEDIPSIEALIKSGVDINRKSPITGNTPLLEAIYAEANDVINLLLELGADPNIPNKYGITPIIALASGDVTEVVRNVVAKGGNVDHQGNDGQTALMMAYAHDNETLIGILTELTKDLELQDKNGETVLFYAARRAGNYNDMWWIDALFEGTVKPNVNHKNKAGQTALHIAVERSPYTIKHLLDKGADPNVLDANKKTPFFILAENEETEDELRYFIENGATIEVVDPETNVTLSAIVHAMTSGNEENAFFLLEIEPDARVDVVDPSNGDTLISIAIRNDFSTDFIEYLHDERNVPVDVPNNDGMTPLHVLAEQITGDNDVNIARILIEAGAPIDAVDSATNTPLMRAIRRENVQLVKFLLEKGANKDIAGPGGRTALEIATDTGNDEIIALLQGKVAPTGGLWKGYDKADAQFFDSIVENADAMNRKTVCPFCLQYAEWGTDCKYLTHRCIPALRHERLYDLYKDERGNVTWCAVCGRHCIGHAHYKLTDTTETQLPSRMPYQPGANVYKAESCPLEGGGGPDEKVRRIDGLLRYVCEVQDDVGKRSATDVRKELIEETWKAASSRIPKTVEDIKQGLRFKTYCDLPSSLASTTTAADIANPNPLPTKHEKEMCNINLEECDVYEFKHVQPDGTLFTHQKIGKDAIRDIIRNSGGTEDICPIEPECKGKLHPDEIKDIFADEVDIYTNYKERFNEKNKKSGGGRTGGNITSPITDVQCAMPEKEKKKGGKTYRKIKKTRRGKRNTYRRRL